MMRSPVLRKATVSFALGLLAAAAQAVVINFEAYPRDYETYGVGNTVISEGYWFAYTPGLGEQYPVGFSIITPSYLYNLGSVALAANSCSALTTMQAVDGRPFTLQSIDLAELNGSSYGHVEFSGITASGAVISHTIVLDGVLGWETFSLPPEFRDLKAATLLQGDCYANPPHMFDNIWVYPSSDVPADPVPLPQLPVTEVPEPQLSEAQLLARLIEKVERLVAQGEAPAGLIAPLKSFERSLNKGNSQAATKQAGAFINQLGALVKSRKLSEEKAISLVRSAQQLLESIDRICEERGLLPRRASPGSKATSSVPPRASFRR